MGWDAEGAMPYTELSSEGLVLARSLCLALSETGRYRQKERDQGRRAGRKTEGRQRRK